MSIKGPAIFLAQFAGDEAPFNNLENISKWASDLGYIGVQIPSWDARLFDLKKASELDKLLQPLHSSLFIESNPSPVKYAASILGMCKPEVRLPLVEIRNETKIKVEEALKVANLL